MTASKRDELTDRQQRFAFHVANGDSHANAARTVGYKPYPGTIHRTANLPQVREEVARLRLEANESVDTRMSADWWRKQVWDRYARAATANDEQACISYLKLAGQHLGTLSSELQTSERERAFFAFLDASTRALSPPELPPVTVDVDVDGSSSSDSDGS